MDHYLISGGPGPTQAAEHDPSSLGPQAPKMADRSITGSASHAAHTAQMSQATTDEQYTNMAQAVAALLSTTITAAKDRAVTSGIDQLQRELREQAGRITEVEKRLSDLEEEAQSSHTTAHQASQTQKYLLER